MITTKFKYNHTENLVDKSDNSIPRGFYARNGSFEDITDAVQLFNDYSQFHFGFGGFTDNIVETDWKSPKFQPETDIRLVFAPNNELVGYVEVWTINDPPVHPWIWLRVHPKYSDIGIGPYLMTWAESRALLALDRCPEDARFAYRISTDTTIEKSKSLYSSFDFKLIRNTFRMLIEMDEAPPEPVWPEGITVRSCVKTDSDIEIICSVDTEAFKDHFGYIVQPFENELAWFSNWLKNDETLNDPSLWYLATDGEIPVGLALCAVWDMESRGYGHVNSLGVLRSHRNKGIGLALLHHAFGEYYRRGKNGVTLGVDAENLTGALNLYKKAGMHVHRQFELHEKEIRPGREISVESLGE